MHSLRGHGANGFDRSASLGSRGPINSASSRCCCFNSTITSGEGGADFSATAGALSRTEKFTARITIQTAARPAQAVG